MPYVIQAFLTENPQALIIWVLVWLLLFFLVREILAWYWKTNRIIGLLEEIRDSMQGAGSATSLETVGKNLIPSKTLPQPFDFLLLLKIFGVLFFIGGFVGIFLDRTVYGIGALALSVACLSGAAVIERRAGSTLKESETVDKK